MMQFVARTTLGQLGSSQSQWLPINVAYVRTLACTGTQLKACGNELQLLPLVPPTHCVALAAGAHLVACSPAPSCTRCGQMHYNYNIFKAWQVAGDARWQGPSIMPQRIPALSISGRQLQHNGTTVRMKCVRCARLALSGSHTHTHTLTDPYTCAQGSLPLWAAQSVLKSGRIACPLLLFPLPPRHTLHFDHFAVRCFQGENLFRVCSSVFQRKLHLTSFPPLPMCVCLCLCMRILLARTVHNLNGIARWLPSRRVRHFALKLLCALKALKKHKPTKQQRAAKRQCNRATTKTKQMPQSGELDRKIPFFKF